MKSLAKTSLLAPVLFFVFSLSLSISQPALAQFSPQDAHNRAAVPANMSRDFDVTAVIIRFLIWAMYLIAFVSIAAFVISGFMFIFSAGENMATNARNVLMYAILGLVVALLGWVILNTVATMLNVGVGWGGGGGSGIGGSFNIGGPGWGFGIGF
ncbi:MAG TPA: hypothetical protein GX706_00380 [Candidatus Moranbacteria bacterium]|nr:hypothetical protein [Candidatus Moranbacteria bacterium]